MFLYVSAALAAVGLFAFAIVANLRVKTPWAKEREGDPR